MLDLGQVTIIGTGLLGGSIGLSLRMAIAAGRAQGRVLGVGRTSTTLERARALGCIDAVATDLPAAVQASSLIILATPLSTFANLLEQIAPHQHRQLIVTDVGSTKTQVCADACRLLGQCASGTGLARFIGSHPMAGSEQHGPDAARADLLLGRPCIVTPEAGTDAQALARVESLWTLLGMRVIRLSPQEHDRQVAQISHLPHAIAALLVSLAAREGGLEIASSGFRDTTRVASGDPRVWLDIFSTNRQAMMRALDGLAAEVAEFRRKLAEGDDAAVHAFLAQAKAARDQWLRENQ